VPILTVKEGKKLNVSQTILPNIRRTTMSERIQDYTENDRERERGHADTRSANFECEHKDPHLGCDPGIDVAG
jgi:hypothetical protein